MRGCGLMVDLDRHVEVDENEVIVVSSFFVHDVVGADISMKHPCFRPHIIKAWQESDQRGERKATENTYSLASGIP